MALSPPSSRGAPAGSVPAGGTTGQALEKTSNTDFDTSWQSVANAVSSVFTRTGAVVAADGDYYGTVAAAKTGATQASRYVGATASGAPVAGTFAVGDLVIDQAGGAWTCTVAGTPGTWAPAVPAASVTNAHISPGAAIAASKIAGGIGNSLICTQTLGSTQATFDTNTILGGNIPSTYTHLFFELYGRSTQASNTSGLQARFNNDSGANYGYATMNVANGTVTGGNQNAQTVFALGNIVAASAPAGLAQGCRGEIPAYAGTTFNKELLTVEHCKTSAGGVQDMNFVGGVWLSTAAVTRLTILLSAGSFDVGSVFSLYGLA